MATDLVQTLANGIVGAAQGYGVSNPTEAHLAMIGQGSMLIRTVAEPEEIVGIHVAKMLESVTIRTLMSLRLFHTLPDEGSISLSDLSAKTGAEEALLVRLLRIAVTCQLVQQLADDSFAHTKFNRGYAMGTGPGLAFNLLYDEVFLQLCRFHLYLKEKGPRNLTVSTSHLSHGVRDKKRYIFKANPTLNSGKIVLRDISNAIEAETEGGTFPDNFELMVHDFQKPHPIKGAKAYYLRRVLHDYSDKVCVQILQQIVPVMAQDSVFLVSDYIVPAKITPADIDVTTARIVMFQMAGKERSAEGFAKLFDQVGLVLSGVFKPGFGHYGLVEVRLKSTAAT